MVLSKYSQLDTPSLLIDMDLVQSNITAMQKKAEKYGVPRRLHTKTHKMPELAKLQVAAGASGITVAKVGEAEVMAATGISDMTGLSESEKRAYALIFRDFLDKGREQGIEYSDEFGLITVPVKLFG